MIQFLKTLVLKKLFGCSCANNKQEKDNKSAMKMLNIWNPYQVSSINELKQSFQRVFISSDGQRVLQHLTNIAFMGRGQVSNDIAGMAANEAKQSMVLTIFDMLKVQQTKTPK
jgi:hypothetical protein